MDAMLNERREKIKGLFAANADFHQLFHNDPTVYTYLKMYMAGGGSFEEAMIGCAMHLAKEKQIYYDQALKATSLSSTPAPILMPHDARLLDQDASGGQPIEMPEIKKGSRIGFNGYGAMDGITYVVKSVRGGKLTLECEK